MKAQQAQSKTRPEGQAGNKVNIDAKINPISMEGNVLVTASTDLNQRLAIRNVRLMNGEKGMFLPMPSYRTGNGEFRDICSPITAEFRTQMTEILTSTYKEALTIQQGKITQMTESPVPQMVPAGLSV